MAWRFVPGLEVSSLRSTSSPKSTELWVTLSGTATQRPLSWRGWKTRPWIQLLSGTMFPPSTLDHGVASWIASLRATRASPSVLPGKDLERMILAISGRISNGILSRYSHGSAFLKTCRGTSDLGLTLFSPTYGEWATELKRACLARQKLALLTNGTASSSSVSWATPKVATGDYQYDANKDPIWNLQGQARLWATPQAHDEKNPRDPERAEERGEGRDLADDALNWATPRSRDWKDSGSLPPSRELDPGTATLGQQVAAQWPTPTAMDGATDTRVNRSDSPGAAVRPILSTLAKDWPTPMAKDSTSSSDTMIRGNPTLNGATRNWETPKTSDQFGAREEDGKRGVGLNTQAQSENWPSPRAEDSESCGNHPDSTDSLTGATANWASPRANDFQQDSPGATAIRGKLNHQVSRTSLPAQTTTLAGHLCSRECRRLNPLFVEWLMSWPFGMTAFGSLETELTQWKRRWRSFLFGQNW